MNLTSLDGSIHEIFLFLKKVSPKDHVGTLSGVMFNSKSQIEHEPQDLPSDGWFINATIGWAYDTTIQVQNSMWQYK